MRPYSDQEIKDAVRKYMFGSEHPDVVGYREQSLAREMSSFDRYLWGMKRLCRLGRFKHKRILDVGCGLGWQALTIAMLGHNSVVANDILPSMIEGASECIASLKSSGVKADVTTLCGDICEIDLPDHSFDAIYSLEAIEHVHDLERMFDSFSRLIRPGGTLVIDNDCNIFNNRFRRWVTNMWERRESDWEWANFLRGIRPVEHADARPFKVMRKEIVVGAASHLSEDDINAIVEATAGWKKPFIEQLARTFRPGDCLPSRPEIDWCRNPLTGEYAERLLDPFALADSLRKREFKIQLRHGFRKQPMRLLNGIQFRPLNLKLFDLRPMFIIVGKKL